MDKNEIELVITDYDMHGRGVSKAGDKVFFIDNALLGEKVIAKIYKQKNNVCFGVAKVILKENQNRVQPQCPYYDICGGCNVMHASYEEQLKIKTNAVKNTISKALGKDDDIQPCKASCRQFGYRNKIELRVEGEKIGLCENQSHKIVPIKNCLLCDEWLQKFLEVAKLTLKGNQSIVEIVLRFLQEKLCVVLVTESKRQLKCDVWIKLLNQNFENFSLFQNIRPKNSKNTLGKDYVLLYGSLVQQLEIGKIVTPVSPNSFLQVNQCVQDEIYDFVANNIPKDNFVVNAYSGAGFLTAILAQKAKFVYGVEIDKFAHKDAEKLMQQNNIKNVKNMCGDCSKLLPKLSNEIGQDSCFVVDPARSGLTTAVCEAMKKANPQTIIYISCNPATLARDLKILASDYEIKTIQAYDMFPQTKHVETVVVLKKSKNV